MERRQWVCSRCFSAASQRQRNMLVSGGVDARRQVIAELRMERECGQCKAERPSLAACRSCILRRNVLPQDSAGWEPAK